MIPKEKAKEIYNSYLDLIPIGFTNKYKRLAKLASLLCVNQQLEFMNHLGWKPLENGNVDYWQEVKDELNQL